MDNYIKIASSQGVINANQNIVDFYIPSGGVYNLRDSYIELMCNASSVSDATVAGGIFSLGLRWQNPPVADANTQTHFVNAALVKNCFMESEMKGMVDSRRRCDILRQNLDILSKSRTELVSDEVLNANNIMDERQKSHYGLFSDLNKTGNVKSQYRDQVPIQIRLGDLLDVANAVEYDTSLAGMTRVQVELNLDKVKAYQTLTNENNTMPNPDTFTSTADGTALTSLIFSNGPHGGADTPRRAVPTLAGSPYYVGQIVRIVGTGANGGANVDAHREITSIDFNSTAGSITINFATLGNFDNNQGLGDIVVSIAAADSTSIAFDSANVVLRQVANPRGLRQIAYSTYDLEEDNGGEQTSFRKQYQLPGEATNVMIMFPSENTDLNSVNNDLNTFRLSLNNEFLTDRDITVDSPLYYNQLASTVMNMGMSLRNLQQKPGDSVTGTENNVYGQSPKTVYVANYLQPQQSEKLLNVDLNAGGTGIKKIAIFKQLPRLLSL